MKSHPRDGIKFNTNQSQFPMWKCEISNIAWKIIILYAKKSREFASFAENIFREEEWEKDILNFNS